MSRQVSLSSHSAIRIALLLAATWPPSSCVAQYSVDFVINPYHPTIVDSWLFDINESGHATGYFLQNDGQEVVIYREGEVQILASGPFNTLYSYVGLSINSQGDVAGQVDDMLHFFGHDGSSMPITVPGFDGFPAFLSPGGLNDMGNVLVADYPSSDYFLAERIAVWNATGSEPLTALEPLYPFVAPPDPSDPSSGFSSTAFTASATGLNNSDQFAAGVRLFSFEPGDPDDFEDDIFTEEFLHGYVYDGHGGYQLLQPIQADDEILPLDIDEAGTVLGWSGSELVLWGVDGAILATLPQPSTPVRNSGAFGYPTVQRNNLGEVVAIADPTGGILFYDPNTNEWTDITASIRGLGTGVFDSIQEFNDRRQFVGLAVPPENQFGTFGYVVTPVPEPSAVLLVLGAIWIGYALRREDGRR